MAAEVLDRGGVGIRLLGDEVHVHAFSSFAHPVAAVLGVIAAEESAADAAGDAVEAAGNAVVDEVFAGYGHGGDDRVVMDPYQGR